MPKLSKKRSKVRIALARRWSSVASSASSGSGNEAYRMDIDDNKVPFHEKLLLSDIGDLAEICKSKCDVKYLTTLLYMSLRYLNITWDDINRFLKDIGFMTAETSHKWATMFVKGDYEEFSNDLRGGKQTDSFYDMFPEINRSLRSRSNIC